MNRFTDTPEPRAPDVSSAVPGAETRPTPGYRIIDEKPPEVRDAERRAEAIARRRRVSSLLYQLLDYAFFVLYGLLAVRLALGLLAASEQAGFVVFIHALTAPFYGPFMDIVPALPLARGTFELSIVIALLAYMLLHVAVRGLLHVLVGTRRSI
jgi:hypothetical protein